MRSLAVRFWEKVDRSDSDSCWLWTAAKNSQGYGQIAVGGGTRTIMLAHRCSWELHFGAIPETMYVCHRCDVPLCVNPSHLFVGTCADNHDDMVRKDRHLRGERSASVKITELQAIAIRDADMTSVQLAPIYGLSPRHIRDIRAGRRWAHLPLSPTQPNQTKPRSINHG